MLLLLLLLLILLLMMMLVMLLPFLIVMLVLLLLLLQLHDVHDDEDEYVINLCICACFWILHCQIVKQMRDVLGYDALNSACKRANKRAVFLLRPSLLKRHVKRVLPETSLNLLNGYKVEDHQYSMESYHVLVFHRYFAVDTETILFKCLLSTTLHVNHLYGRFLSCAMFLFRGADMTIVTSKDSPEKLEQTNRTFSDHRRNFEKDVEVLCKLCELVFRAQGCTPNLHSLYHMIRHLLVVKGHPTFEMIV